MKNDPVYVLKAGEHYAATYALVVRQVHNVDAHGQGDGETVLQIRRVIVPENPPREELQIELTLCKRGNKRNTYMSASFCCSPAVADAIAKACAELRS